MILLKTVYLVRSTTTSLISNKKSSIMFTPLGHLPNRNVLGPLTTRKGQVKFLIVGIDYFTK